MNENITDSLESNYMPYTAHVILQRALPEIDGLKPSQRRILYTMYKMGLLKGNRKKSQSIVGQTMFLHAHGDASIYETLVRMTKDNESLLIPYIDSKGNFGKVYSRDTKEAHGRYTEAKLMPISEELFKGMNEDAVDMIDNYDGTLKEPRFLPVSFPNILTNSQSGTAVGMASGIPSFNLGEVLDFTIAYIKDRDSEVIDYIKAPDFPTGGSVIYNKDLFKGIYNTGRGTFKIRANYKIEEDSIIFYDIPYTTTFEVIIDRVSNLVKEGKIKDIIDIDDIYGIKTKGIEITVKKNTNKEELVEKLFKMTSLEDSFGCNFNIVVNGRPQVLGIKPIIDHWIKYRASTLTRVFNSDKSKKIKKKQELLALRKVLLDVDKAVEIIKNTGDDEEVLINLSREFEISREQSEYVSNIRLKSLNKENMINQIKKIESLNNEIKRLDELIENKVELAKYIINELSDIKKKYAEDRKTDIIDESDIKEVSLFESSIEDFNLKFFITEEGYLKKIPLTSLRGNFTIRIKDTDKIIDEIETTNMSEVLIFTDKRNVYKYKAHEIENHKPSSLGEFLPSLLELEDEKIINVSVVEDYKNSGFMLVGFKDGKVSKFSMKNYETKTNRRMLKNAYADKEVVFMKHLIDDVDLFAVSSIDKVLLINTSTISEKTSKTTGGVQVIRSKDDSYAKSYIVKTDNLDIKDPEYYRVKSAGVGKYIKKDDSL